MKGEWSVEENLTNHSHPNDLLRLKKSLQLIQEVVRSYEVGLYDHVGFSCAIAISKAEELENIVSRFCPVYPAFGQLILALKGLHEERTGGPEAVQAIEKINSYFGLDRYELIPRPNPPLENT